MSYESILFLTILLVILATGIIVLVLVYQKKQLQYLSEREQMQGRFEREILESKLEMQEQTMKHISQEVHDNIGQVLSVVKLNINMMSCDDPKHVLKEKIMDTSGLVGKVIQDLRNLSKSLDSDAITERGLAKGIEYEFDLLKKTGIYDTKLVIEGEPYSLPDHKELILFRIFQEAINNVIKHAKATMIEVSLRFSPGKFLLCINDNGKGFDSRNIDANNGSGIRNIMNRSRLIGACYHIDSQPGEGTEIQIELQVQQANSIIQE